MGDTSFSGGHTAAGAAVGSSTPSTQAHADSAASGSSAEAARVDHKHAMPAAGGVSQANQAALEAETNEDTYAPPDLIHHLPGVAKCWISINQSSSHTISSSYNVASITDGGAGKSGVVVATDFSSVEYTVVMGTTGLARCTFERDATNAVGLFDVSNTNEGTTQEDSSGLCAAAFGDQ
jgi:hypothetical protein